MPNFPQVLVVMFAFQLLLAACGIKRSENSQSEFKATPIDDVVLTALKVRLKNVLKKSCAAREEIRKLSKDTDVYFFIGRSSLAGILAQGVAGADVVFNATKMQSAVLTYTSTSPTNGGGCTASSVISAGISGYAGVGIKTNASNDSVYDGWTGYFQSASGSIGFGKFATAGGTLAVSGNVKNGKFVPDYSVKAAHLEGGLGFGWPPLPGGVGQCLAFWTPDTNLTKVHFDLLERSYLSGEFLKDQILTSKSSFLNAQTIQSTEHEILIDGKQVGDRKNPGYIQYSNPAFAALSLLGVSPGDPTVMLQATAVLMTGLVQKGWNSYANELCVW